MQAQVAQQQIGELQSQLAQAQMQGQDAAEIAATLEQWQAAYSELQQQWEATQQSYAELRSQHSAAEQQVMHLQEQYAHLQQQGPAPEQVAAGGCLLHLLQLVMAGK